MTEVVQRIEAALNDKAEDLPGSAHPERREFAEVN
jgi:hypothetical protein